MHRNELHGILVSKYVYILCIFSAIKLQYLILLFKYAQRTAYDGNSCEIPDQCTTPHSCRLQNIHSHENDINNPHFHIYFPYMMVCVLAQKCTLAHFGTTKRENVIFLHTNHSKRCHTKRLLHTTRPVCVAAAYILVVQYIIMIMGNSVHVSNIYIRVHYKGRMKASIHQKIN